MTQTTVIGPTTALVGHDLELVRDAIIVVEDGRIGHAGHGAEIAAPPGDAFDGRGLVLAPGFIDAHVHIGFFDPAEVLRGGITTARDLGWPPDDIFPLAERSIAEDFAGPTVVAAGPMLTVDGGYPTRAAWAPPGTGLVVDGPAHARAVVDEVVEHGAIVVKVALNAAVGPTLDAATLTSIVDAAHGRGRKVTGHVTGLDELRKAIASGVDELAHMLMSHEVIPDDVLRDMVSADMTIVPTLSVRFGDDQRRAVRNLARYLEFGGRVVYGTDLGNEGPRPGIDAREVAAMSAAGMSVLDIIACATTRSSRWLELDDRGAIAPGLRADLVALDERSLTNGDLLARPRAVWRAGRRAL